MPEKLESELRSKLLALGASALIGTLGGLIGLGGAEFRLPVLIDLFRFRGLEAVILNKATSLVVVATALPFRAGTVPFSAVGANWLIIVNLLAGRFAGAWVGAAWAIRAGNRTRSIGVSSGNSGVGSSICRSLVGAALEQSCNRGDAFASRPHRS
jgi:uncharacterized membrane protein YfcA